MADRFVQFITFVESADGARLYFHLVPADDPVADPAGAFVEAFTSAADGEHEDGIEGLIRERLGAHPRVDVGVESLETALGGRVVARQYFCRLVYHS